MFTQKLKTYGKKHYVAISRLILATFFIFIILSLNKNFNKYLNSDMSSELILAEHLHSEHKILSTDWYYSTELRVFNTQLVFTPLFEIFNNWHTVRIVGTTLLLVLLLISFFIFCDKIHIKYKYVLSLYIVGAYSIQYFNFVVVGTYYIPHIVISFFTLALLSNIFKRNKIIISNLVLITLSFIAGLGGIRQLVILYLPLCVTSTLYLLYSQLGEIKKFRIDIKCKSFLVWSSTLLMGITSLIGYIVNVLVLQKYFTFFNYTSSSVEFASLEKLKKIFIGLLHTHGLPYHNSTGISVGIKIIMCICFAIWSILIIYASVVFIKAIIKKHKNICEEHIFVFIFYIVALIITITSFSFSNVMFKDRYFLPVSIFFVPVIGIFLTSIKNIRSKAILLMVLIFQIMFCTYSNIKIANSDTANNELTEIIKVLELNESYEGYASFWNANILTELSNGKIEAWDCGDKEEQFDIYNMYQWLQLKNHSYLHPENNIFFLASTNEIEKFNLKNIDSTKEIYRDEKYIVYLFKDYGELLASFPTNQE